MQVGNITPYSLEKNFSSFYYQIAGRHWNYTPRVLHNQEQIIRCQLRDDTATPTAIVKYWNMDGTEAAQFTVGSGGVPYTNILDMGWLIDLERLCYVIMASGGASLGTDGYSIVSALPDGSSPDLLIQNINTANTITWSGTTQGASLSGYVGFTTSDEHLYLKIGPELHVIDRSTLTASTPWEWADLVTGGHVVSATDCFHYGNGANCRNLTYQDSTTGSGHVLYTWYDSAISVLYLRSISVSGTSMSYLPDRWTMLNIPEYTSIKYPVFINQLDPSALHYLSVTATGISAWTVTTTPAYLQVFNIDSSLAAFLNVNSSDTVMPAGVGATSEILAKVANCWGTTLSGKLVQFWVSSGDGGVYPTYTYTDDSGRASTTFTTGANVGISNVAVVVNEI
jgi:hypothetical protein